MISGNSFSITLLLVLFAFLGPVKTFPQELVSLPAEEDAQKSDGLLWITELKGGYNYLFKALLSGSVIQPADSTQNPRNDLLKIPRYVLKGEFRPDFSLKYYDIKLSIKPRFVEILQRIEDGELKGQNTADDEIYVTEWLASYKLHENWFVSYGRENLQWGPSFLLSPSNPFFRENGQANPKFEVRGMDFVRTVWVINPSWTLSLIDNVGEGEQKFLYGFEPTYAMKMDYTAFQKYASLIGSYTEHNRFHFGGFGGWTVFDGLLLYTEGNLSAGTNALYPQKIYFQPLDLEIIQMVPEKEDAMSLEALWLLGASYTFESGQTVTAEYVFNSAGYSHDEAVSYYQYRQVASQLYDYPYYQIGDLGKKALVQTLDPKLRLLRKNYLMLQYQEFNIWEKLNLMIRCTINLDDTSTQLISNLGYDLGDHAQLYLNGFQNVGNTETEFGSIFVYGLTLGIEYVF